MVFSILIVAPERTVRLTWPFREVPRWSQDEFREWPPEWRDDDAPVTELQLLTPDDELGTSGTRAIDVWREVITLGAFEVVPDNGAVVVALALPDSVEFDCVAVVEVAVLTYSCGGTSKSNEKITFSKTKRPNATQLKTTYLEGSNTRKTKCLRMTNGPSLGTILASSPTAICCNTRPHVAICVNRIV